MYEMSIRNIGYVANLLIKFTAMQTQTIIRYISPNL